MDQAAPFSVQWYEGMLLSPQHFQYFSSGLQTAIINAANAVSNFCYGVSTLKIDTSSLANGVIRIISMAGMFQDGTQFNFDSMQDAPLEKNVKDHLATPTDKIVIYVGIIRNRPGENLLESGNQRYYTSVLKNINDENIGSNPIDICVLKPKLQLLLANEIDARYVYFPLLKIKKSESNGIDIINYIPPMTVLDTHSKAMELIRTLVADLRNKISFFSDRKGNASFVLGAEIQSNLKLLIKATLALEAITKINKVQPFLCYQYLLDTASTLAAMNVEQSVPSLPKYDHENLYDTFVKLTSFCRESINYIKQPFVTIPFVKDNNVFFLKLDKSWLKGKEFFISVKKKLSQSDNELLHWIEGVQITSESSLTIVKNRRVLGATRKIVERGENIVPPNGSIILSIDSQDPYILASENLYITNPADDVIVPEEIVLYVDK